MQEKLVMQVKLVRAAKKKGLKALEVLLGLTFKEAGAEAPQAPGDGDADGQCGQVGSQIAAGLA